MPRFSSIILSYILVFLMPVMASSSEESVSEQECHSIFLSRLCFTGAKKLRDLVPLAEIAEQSRKTSLKKRSGFTGQSKVSEMQRRELELKWKQIFAQVMAHARAHSLNLQNLDSMFPDELGVLSSPILFHESFEWDGQSQFKISSSKVVKTNTLLEISQRLAVEGGYFSQSMSKNVRSWISRYGQGRDQIKVESLMQDFFVEALFELTLPGALPVEERVKALAGVDVFWAYFLIVENVLRERSGNLTPKIHFFAPQNGKLVPPEVLPDATLVLSDETINTFSPKELELIMYHEATHLARPNVFMVSSISHAIISQHFPELQAHPVAGAVDNLLNLEQKASPEECPVLFSADDEIFVDYYVLSFLAAEKSKQRDYQDLLRKLRDIFGTGVASQMSFRVKAIDYSLDRIALHSKASFSQERVNALFKQSITNAFGRAISKGRPMKMSDAFDELSQWPETRSEGELIKLVFNYYRSTAFSAGPLDEVKKHCSMLDVITAMPRY